MPTAVKTNRTELGDSRVRVDVEVASDALERELQTAASDLGRDMRVPGFRKGKVPPQVVLRQVGREAVLDEAVRRAMPGWYEQALHDAGVAAVGDPKLAVEDLPEHGAPLAFSIEVGVVPEAQLGDYRGVEVGRREPEVEQDEVDAELQRLRESFAALESVDREAADGDFVVMDFTGRVDGEEFEGGDARGYLLELGSGRLIPGFEEQLQGVKPGEGREVKLTFPDDYPAEHLAGKEAVFSVEAKEVKEKRLPELDDDFSVQAGGYDTLDELRDEIGSKLREAEERSIEQEFREAAVDAVVAEAKLEVPHELVHEKAHEMWHRTSSRLEAQGMDPSQYLQLSGKTEEELVQEAEPEAELSLKREAVLAAIVQAEGIEVTDVEVDEALLEAVGQRGGAEPSEKQLKRALKRARAQGAEDAVREDLAMRKAVDVVVESAQAIPVEQAKARDKLWTPGKEQKEPAGELWTPGQ